MVETHLKPSMLYDVIILIDCQNQQKHKSTTEITSGSILYF